MAKTTESLLSLAPEDARKGGGLLNDVDVVIREIAFAEYDYNGQLANPQIGMVATLEDLESEDTSTQFWSCGGKEGEWEVVGDGKGIKNTVDPERHLTDNCNAMLFLTSLVNCGLDSKILRKGDISALEGLGFHAIRYVTERKGFVAEDGKPPKTTVVAEALLFDPGEEDSWKNKGSKKSSPAPKAKGKAKAEEVEEEEVPEAETEEEVDVDPDWVTAAGILVKALRNNDGAIAKAALTTKIIPFIPKGEDRSKMAKIISSQDFLDSFEEWTVKGGKVTLND